MAAALLLAGAAQAHPIVYTAWAITDGRLGGVDFRDAAVRIRFEGDTRDVSAGLEQGAMVYRNERGEATITVTRGGDATTARIHPGQIYVRYDISRGVVGFATHAIGPTYPLSLSCGVASAFGCTPAANGAYEQIGAALADVHAHPQDAAHYSAAVAGQETHLAAPALLTGYVGACAVPYVNGVCPAMPAVPIHTDRGELYFQDLQVWGTGMFTVVNDPD